MRKLKKYTPTKFMAEDSHYDKDKADFAVNFIENLCHTKGTWARRKFELMDWQEQIIRDVFGTIKPNGYRQFNMAYVEIPKKNGKSELAAAVALLLLCEGEQRGEIYSCAADKNQAKIVFDVAADMVRFSKALSKRIKIYESQKKLEYLPTKSTYQVLSADVSNKHGFNTHGVIFDELHTQPNRKLYDVMVQGSGDARMQPLYFLITTAGNNTESICYEVHQKAMDIMEGRKHDSTFYPVIFGAGVDEDWTDPKVWKKANPSLGETIGIDKVQAACDSARQNPGEENAFRQLRLNQWVKQSIRWMPMEKWDACAFPVDEDELEGRVCYGGLDLSSTTDLTSFCLVFPPEDENDKYYVLPYFWLPEETLDLRVRTKHEEDVAALEKKISDTADEVAKQMSSTGNLVQKIMSISDYNRLSAYDKNTMYYCYDNADTQEIKAIYLGQHVIYATGVSVTYQVDTNNAITQTASLTNDAIASAPKVTKAGYTFVGWKSDTTADDAVIDKYVISSASAIKLYAVFKKTIVIDMDRMDSELLPGAKESSVEALLFYNNGKVKSEEVTIPECPYAPEEGMSFSGWSINPLDLNGVYMPNEKYTFTADQTLLPCYIETEHEFDNPYASSTYFKIEGDGLYEFDCWGAEGGHASGTIDNVSYEAKGGKGGHVKVYKKLKRGQVIYVYNGYHPTGTNASYNYGGLGNSYSSTKHIGAAGGGATYVTLDTSMQLAGMSSSNVSNYYSKRDKIILIAGGGGGAGISASNYDYPTNPTQSYTKGAHNGGDAGGLKGGNGSSGVLGGQQISGTSNEYSNWGYCTSPSSSNSTYSGGGSGWYAGNYGTNGNSGAGGSSYVGNNPTFTYNGVRYKTVNEGGVHEGHGRTHMRYVMPCKVE